MTPQIKKILYATDLSKNSSYAYRYAINLAEKYNAEIVILHVIEPIPPIIKHYVKGFVDEINWDQKIKYEQEVTLEGIKNHLEEFCKRESINISQCLALISKTLVRPGYPLEEILKAADEEQCSLIILGTHGKGFLKQTFLGSVARSVLDRAKTPVLVIPFPIGEPDVAMGEI